MLPWSLENRISLKILFTYRDEGVSLQALQITMEFQFWLVRSCSEVVGDSLCLQGARAQTFWRKKGTWRKRRELRGVRSISD